MPEYLKPPLLLVKPAHITGEPARAAGDSMTTLSRTTLRDHVRASGRAGGSLQGLLCIIKLDQLPSQQFCTRALNPKCLGECFCPGEAGMRMNPGCEIG